MICASPTTKQATKQRDHRGCRLLLICLLQSDISDSR